MEEFERFLRKISESGFKFEERKAKWGRRFTGTKPGSFLKTTEKTLIALFETGNPTQDQFSDFVKETERFYADNKRDSVIQDIYVVTPQNLDKKQYKFILERMDGRVGDCLKYKALTISKATAERERLPDVTGGLPIAEAMDAVIPNRSVNEKVMSAWEVVFEERGKAIPLILATTQERGVLLRKAGADIVLHGVEFKWEDVTNLKAEELEGSPILRVNDGDREYHFSHSNPDFLARLFRHLQWAREGYITCHMEEHGFDPDLVGACQTDLMQGRYVDAVNNAFRLLESRIKSDSFASSALYGRELIEHAFGVKDGKIAFGRNDTREAIYFLFRGATGLFRNPVAHNYDLPGFGKEEAFEALALVNLLMKMSRRGYEEATKR